jgi:hypothetical protein
VTDELARNNDFTHSVGFDSESTRRGWSLGRYINPIKIAEPYNIGLEEGVHKKTYHISKQQLGELPEPIFRIPLGQMKDTIRYTSEESSLGIDMNNFNPEDFIKYHILSPEFINSIHQKIIYLQFEYDDIMNSLLNTSLETPPQRWELFGSEHKRTLAILLNYPMLEQNLPVVYFNTADNYIVVQSRLSRGINPDVGIINAAELICLNFNIPIDNIPIINLDTVKDVDDKLEVFISNDDDIKPYLSFYSGVSQPANIMQNQSLYYLNGAFNLEDRYN